MSKRLATSNLEGSRTKRNKPSPKCVICKLFSVSKLGELCSDCDPRERRRYRMLKGDVIRDLLRKHDIKFEDEVKIDFQRLVPSDPSRQTRGNRNMKKYCKTDFVVYREDTVFIIEVDDMQHASYLPNCDSRRIMQIFESQLCTDSFASSYRDEYKTMGPESDVVSRHRARQKLVVVRYNPDAFRRAGTLVSVPSRVRQSRLVEFLKTYEPRLQREIHYMYYDVDSSGVALPATDPQFNDDLRSMVVPWDHCAAGYPLCQHPDECKSLVQYRYGGVRDRCIRHGGYPMCQHPDGCSTPVNYKDGGVRDRCIRHGGYPSCQHPDGCSTSVQYRRGGIRNRCRRHGGYPSPSSSS